MRVSRMNTAELRVSKMRLLQSGIAISAILLAAAPAMADTAPAGDQASSGDIVVTARRVDEKLRDVPVAVAAFSGKALAEQRIDSEADLQIATPGLTVRATSSSNDLNYSIRGQSVDSFSFSSPAVVAYSNNVPISGATATSFFDLESIQVLKGPQGTLFGRNATGGAVLYQATKPTQKFEGYVTAGYGNFSNREVEGALNLPITNGVAIRLSGKSTQRDGYENDLLNGTKLGSKDDQVGRISLLIKPEGSGFENVFEYQHGLYRGLSSSLKIQNANQVGQTYDNPYTGQTGILLNAPSAYQFMAADYPSGVAINQPGVNALLSRLGIASGINNFIGAYASGKLGFYDVAPTQDSAHHATQDFVSNTTSYKIGDSALIKNIFGYNRVLSRDNTDLTGTPYAQLVIGDYPNANPASTLYSANGFYNGGYTYGSKQWSDELQISGTAVDGKLKYVAGLFISDSKSYDRIPFSMQGDINPTGVGGCSTNPNASAVCGAGFLGIAYDFQQEDKSKAAYAQLSYEVLPKVNISGGIRITKDDISISYPDQTADNVDYDTLLPASKSATKPSWLIGIDYKPTSELLIYFNQRGSWRTGGFNGTSPGVNLAGTGPGNLPEGFGSETTYDFELGAKFSGRVADVPTSLNIALYDQEISNVQRSPYHGLSALAVNIPHAQVRGIELDGSVRPTTWLQVGAAFTYTDPKYTQNVASMAFGTFYAGPYGDTPKYVGSAYFRAATDLPNDKGELALRGEIYTQSSFWYSNLGNTTAPGTQLSGYSLVNARAEWNKILGSQVSLAAYVNNLTDKQYYTGGISLSSVEGTNAALPGTPRTFGFDVNVKF